MNWGRRVLQPCRSNVEGLVWRAGATYVEYGKYIFASSQSGPVLISDVVIMLAETIGCAETNCEGEEEGNEPGENYDLVVPGNIADDEEARDETGSDEDGGEDQSGGCDGEDGWTAIGYMLRFGRLGVGHG